MSADKDNTESGGDARQALLKQSVEAWVAVRLVEVVEDQRTGRPQAAAEALEVPGNECGQVGEVLGEEERQRLSESRGCPFRCVPHVVEESGRISIGFVHLVPQGGQPPGLHVGRHQARLPAAGGSTHPSDAPFPGAVEEVEEAPTRYHRFQDRTGHLGVRNRRAPHVPPLAYVLLQLF